MVEPVQNSEVPNLVQSAAAGAGASAGADFTTFLKMLTTQIKYQDPLKPQDPSDFAVQLATFSSVEQQAHTNKLLKDMLAQQGGGGLGQAANWIGKETRTTVPVWLSDKPLVLDIQPAFGADDAALIVLNAKGAEVSRQKIGREVGEYEWDGRNSAGEFLPKGRYSFRLESLINNQPIADDEVGVFARITGVSNGDEGPELIFDNGATAKFSQVDMLREPR